MSLVTNPDPGPRTGVKRIGKETKEEEGRKGEEKDEEKERNEYKQTPHIR